MSKTFWLCEKHKIINDPHSKTILACPGCFAEVVAQRDALLAACKSAVGHLTANRYPRCVLKDAIAMVEKL